MTSYHSVPAEVVLRELDTHPDGLTSAEATRRLQQFGTNELAIEQKVSALRLLLDQFKSILIIILLVATVLSAAIGEFIDAIVIVAIVAAAAGVGFLQEYRAEHALEALKRMIAPTVLVLRDGDEQSIPSRDLVPGDILLTKAGDRVAADCRVIENVSLQVDEASLTGESVPVSKTTSPVSDAVSLPERTNMLFSGTTVTYGRGKAVVVATGISTEFGKIAKEVTAVIEQDTPLERRMRDVGRLLVNLSVGVVVAVATIAIVREYLLEGSIGTGFLLEMILFAIALAVAAVPEALPAIVTGSLAIGMREMAKRNALVRRMPAVETLGSTTVICSDKTGTLTKGEMTVRGLYADDAYFVVSGVGYTPAGKIGDAEENTAHVSSTVSELLTALVLCNDSVLHQVEGRWRVEGDPTEGALLVVGVKGGLDPSKVRTENPRVGEVPFSSERKLMTTVHKLAGGSHRIFTKGAPEVVLQRCTRVKWNGSLQVLTGDLRKRILAKNEAMAGEALRVLGAAYRDAPDSLGRVDESAETELIFLGLAGMIDPPREEAIEAVRVAKSIRMRSIMVTGDHRLTAIAVGREMGIYSEGDLVMTGEDLDRMDDEEFKRTVDKISVYARVSPLHKLRIVKAWKERGEVVAVTGDGVNDAPAIKHADIGVAMGITGTDVTKEAADLILGDDNFATIVKAVELGRWVVDNIKKYLTYLLQCNIIEVILLGGAVFAGLPLPLLPAQILWINLTTDGLPALALGVAPPEPDVMRRPPRDPRKSIFDREVKAFLVTLPAVLAPIILLSFILSLPEGIPVARTRLFFIFVFFELVIAIGSTSLRYSISRARPYRLLLLAVLISFGLSMALLHPALIGIFDLAYIPIEDWVTIAFLSLLPLPMMEMIKWLLHRSTEAPAL